MAQHSTPFVSMRSFIQELLASTFNASLSRKRKRGPSPNSHLTTTTTATEKDDTALSTSNIEYKNIETSGDREKRIALFLALAGESALTKRVKMTGDNEGEMNQGGVKKNKKKLSVISEEDDASGDKAGDVAMEGIQFCGPPVEQHVWTHRGGCGFQL